MITQSNESAIQGGERAISVLEQYRALKGEKELLMNIVLALREHALGMTMLKDKVKLLAGAAFEQGDVHTITLKTSDLKEVITSLVEGDMSAREMVSALEMVLGAPGAEREPNEVHDDGTGDSSDLDESHEKGSS